MSLPHNTPTSTLPPGTSGTIVPASDSLITRKQSLLDQFLKKGRGAPKTRRTDTFAQAVIRHDSSRRKGIERRHVMITSVSTKKPDPPAASIRRNYSKGADLLLMEKAVSDWTKKEGGYLTTNNVPRSMRSFATHVGIPYKTLRNYLTGKEKNKRAVGASCGRKANFSSQDTQFVSNVLARADRGNEGKNRKEAIDLVQELKPALDRKQASRALTRHVLRKSEDLKNNLVKATATTTNRSAITVGQQFRWHNTYESCLNLLRKRNTSLCKKSGKSFGEVMHHFIIGGDESCFMASANGDCRVIGSRNKKKHEKNIADTRASITAYRTGAVGGSQGPTVMLMKGTRKRTGYSNSFLVKHGCCKGSTVIMTDSAFMTTAAWEEMTPCLMIGYRSMPYIVDNPDWWFIEITDGFGPHHNSLSAMEMRANGKCISLKEEGDSSHVNQAYDKFVAKGDKKSACDSLNFLRSARYRIGHGMDQWSLVHVVLQCVKGTSADTWTNSFKACNLDPRTRVDFKAWCDRISQYLLAGQTFKKEENVTVGDVFAMMPSFWKGMEVSERKEIQEIIKRHNNEYTVECVKEIQNNCHVPLKDMHNIRLIDECVTKYTGLVEWNNVNQAIPHEVESPHAEVEQVEKLLKNANDGLSHFELKPAGLKGCDLFDHMLKYRGQQMGETNPSDYLGIEVSNTQKGIIMPTERELTQGKIIRDTVGLGAQLKLAKRKLDNLGYIKSHSGIQNDKERLKRLKSQLTLAASLAEINVMKESEKSDKEEDTKNDYRKVAKQAYDKYMANINNMEKLTKKEMAAIMLVAYQDFVDMDKLKKPEMIKMLGNHVLRRPNAISTLQGYDYVEGAPNGLAALPTAVSEIMMENINEEEVVELNIDDIDVDLVDGLRIQSV